MGMDLIYRCNGREFVHRFSMSDWETLDLMGQLNPDAVSKMVDVPDFGDEVLIPLADLRDAIKQIDEQLRDQPELLPYTYQIAYEMYFDNHQTIKFGFSTGGLSGIRLLGDEDHWCYIRAGLTECRLQRMELQTDGTVKIVEERNLRGLRELRTVNFGGIRIRKRRAKSSLRKGLAAIQDFLTKQPEGYVVIKIVC